MAPKRPSGLGKASKQKKPKQSTHEEEAELNIELQDEVQDEELAEVYGLYSKLQEERDPRIARGLVHECDQLLKARDEENKELPPKFHVVYGGALLTLAESADSEQKEFRDAGVERINKGIKSNDLDALGLASFELIQYAHTQISSKTGELSAAGKKLLKYAVNLLEKRSSKQHVELARSAHRLLLLADELGDEDEAVGVAQKVLRTQAASNDAEVQRLGHKGLAQYYMMLVAPAFDAMPSDDEETKEEEATLVSVRKDLSAALDHLRKCVSDSDEESHTMLAEALLQWAEIVSETEKDAAYSEALRHLKKARLLGNNGLNEIIESIENPED